LISHFQENGNMVNGGPSNKIGFSHMIGWSIVNQKMQHFACTVTFSFTWDGLKNLGVMSLQEKVMRSGRRLLKDLISMLVQLLTTMEE
jgi:hypothetical protein